MPILHCSMPHCIHKNPDGTCNAEEVELMFGLVIQLPGQGAIGFQRCAQHMTAKDLVDNAGISDSE